MGGGRLYAGKMIVLITDFGVSSPYVAEMKGAILSISPGVQIIDGTHTIPPQDVLQGAIALRQIAPVFPAGVIFVTVVDPGVGTDREILLLAHDDKWFIAPNNGVLSLIASDSATARVIDQPRFWRGDVSYTFHGRDIMGPVAAHLHAGVGVDDVAVRRPQQILRCSLPQPSVSDREAEGEIVAVDSFGNLISNIPGELVSGVSCEVRFANRTLPVCATYGEQPMGAALSLLGSSGWLEVAINGGSARKDFQANIGDKILLVRGD